LGKGLTAGPHLSVSGAKRKGRGGGAGPAGLRSWANLGRPARAVRKKEKACWPGMVAGQKRRKGERDGPAVDKREKREERFSFFFKFIFQTFKLQSNKNPCNRIMMHKHLLFLNYFSDV
jgi:hypothetical protein